MPHDRRAVSMGLGAGLLAGRNKRSSEMSEARPKAEATPDLDARLTVLDDRRAIEELRSRYGWFAARGDAAGVASLFTEDCLYEGPAGGPGKRDTVRTRAALSDYLQARLRPAAQLPFLYNHIIKVSGDHAEGTCAIKPQVMIGDKAMVGYYVEKLRRVGGDWRFYDRRFYLYQPYFESPEAA
jgi:hypothetical protein